MRRLVAAGVLLAAIAMLAVIASLLLGRFSKGRLGRWPLLYDLELDPGERYNLIGTHPDVGQKLLEKMAEWEENLRENPRGWTEDQ